MDPAQPPLMSPAADFRSGYVTIVGAPNVGKSTLMNALLGQKISIVTHKAQTTRHRILGILSSESSQIVFLDTPGIITPRYALQEVMMQFASSAVEDADLVLFMIDATDPGTEDEAARREAFRLLPTLRKPVFLVINKTDLLPKASLLPIIDAYARLYPFREVFPVSALRADGLEPLVAGIVPLLPAHPPYFPLDIVSEQHQRFFVAEIIREKIFLRCREEVPYSATVDIVEFAEREAGKWYVSADIYVERDSQKAIVIGKKGAMLKEIGRVARADIEAFLEHSVYLELHVKVREKWRQDKEWLNRLGYGPH